MAQQQNKLELTLIALERSWQYQKQVAELEGTKPPNQLEQEEQFFQSFGGRKNPDDDAGRDPYAGAPVPKGPLPSIHGGEVILPLPDDEETET